MVKLKTQQEVVRTYQDFETLRLVIAEALGGSKAVGHSPAMEAPDTVQDYNQLMQAFAGLGGVVNG